MAQPLGKVAAKGYIAFCLGCARRQGMCYCCLALAEACCLAVELPMCPIAAPVYDMDRRQPLRCCKLC
jgi:hypothetical protein